MTNNIVPTNPEQSPFDSVRKFRADGSEFWSARELMAILQYTKWQKFKEVIDIAKENLETVDINGSSHFLPVEVKSLGRNGLDFELSRLACYHVALASDSRGKDAVKMAKHYFATKTREAEVTQLTSPVESTQKRSLPVRDAVDYIQAADILSKLPDNRLTRLLNQRLVDEVALVVVNQKQIAPVTGEIKQYTTATVRASQLGYSAKQIGNGTTLGKFVKAEIAPEFSDWQGQYMVNHFEVNDRLDSRIHAFFLTRSL